MKKTILFLGAVVAFITSVQTANAQMRKATLDPTPVSTLIDDRDKSKMPSLQELKSITIKKLQEDYGDADHNRYERIDIIPNSYIKYKNGSVSWTYTYWTHSSDKKIISVSLCRYKTGTYGGVYKIIPYEELNERFVYKNAFFENGKKINWGW